ncbi:hypothetical protein ACH414_29050 [Streptomyces sp. NPDC020422]|uniref:hypothetical protein n=1 Tax=Streptomyces sp. NPDC020422 TaxID=3365074 RepID=UPI0037AB3A80
MTMQLQAVFQSTLRRPLRIGDYMGNLPFGTGDIIGPEVPATAPSWLERDVHLTAYLRLAAREEQ